MMGLYDMKGMFVYNNTRHGIEAHLVVDAEGYFETTMHDPLFSCTNHVFGKMESDFSQQSIRFVRSPHQNQRDGLFFSLTADSLDQEVIRFSGGWYVFPEEKSRQFRFALPWREAELDAFYQYLQADEPQGSAALYLLHQCQTKYL